jgi:hypothetical protein
MFWALLAHPQEALVKQQLVYCVRVLSVSCTRIEVGRSSTSILVHPTEITRMQYTKCHLFIGSWGWASNARNMQRPLILNKLYKDCITLVLLYGYTMMHGQQNISFIKSLQANAATLKLEYDPFRSHAFEFITQWLFDSSVLDIPRKRPRPSRTLSLIRFTLLELSP